MTEDEAIELKTLARLNNFLPDIKVIFDRRIALIEARVSAEIESGNFNENKALLAWHEVHAYNKVLRSLDAKARISQAKAGNVRLDE